MNNEDENENEKAAATNGFGIRYGFRWLLLSFWLNYPQGFGESANIAQRGGEVAHGARKLIEKELGRSVISPSKASDYISSTDNVQALPEGEEAKD